jgi:hypothetical protein
LESAFLPKLTLPNLIGASPPHRSGEAFFFAISCEHRLMVTHSF